MAERLKVKLLESDKLVDIVAGPDAYRDIPRLIDTIEVSASAYGYCILQSYDYVNCLRLQFGHKEC